MACAKLINNAHHGKALRCVWRLLLSGVERKEHLVWLYGLGKYDTCCLTDLCIMCFCAASCGKSEFIRRLRAIFASVEVDWSAQYLPESKRNLPDVKEQLVTCEEFSCENALAKGQIHKTKQLFEGEGAMVRPDLFKQHEQRFKDAVFVIGTNDLPLQEAQARAEQHNTAII